MNKKDLQQIFTGYKRVDTKMIKQLEQLGFIVERRSKHVVISYNLNNRTYKFSLAFSPSDNRTGLNIASTIYTTLFR